MIHLVGPVVLAATFAGAGVYGLIARRNAVLVLVGAELLLNSATILLVTASTLPAGGLSALSTAAVDAGAGRPAADPLLAGQVMTVFAVTIAAAEIGLALAVVLLLYRRRATSDLTAVRELGEASPSYSETPGAGDWPEPPPPPPPPQPPAPSVAEATPAPRPDSIAAWLATGDPDPEPDSRDSEGSP